MIVINLTTKETDIKMTEIKQLGETCYVLTFDKEQEIKLLLSETQLMDLRNTVAYTGTELEQDAKDNGCPS